MSPIAKAFCASGAMCCGDCVLWIWGKKYYFRSRTFLSDETVPGSAFLDIFAIFSVDGLQLIR